MKNKKSYMSLFVNESLDPIGTFAIPAIFELDATHLGAGNHFIKLIDSKAKGKKKIKIIPFTVEQNRSVFIFIGTKKRQIVNEIIPLNYRPDPEIKEDQKTSASSKIKLMIASFFGAAGISQL